MAAQFTANVARFSDFEFDLKARELRKHGTRLRLEDKPAQLLALLLESAPEVLTRTELQSRLWPTDVNLDREHGLNKCINRLRTVLGDDPGQPRFIETLSRRGYRFVAPVQLLGREDLREAQGGSAQNAEPSKVFVTDSPNGDGAAGLDAGAIPQRKLRSFWQSTNSRLALYVTLLAIVVGAGLFGARELMQVRATRAASSQSAPAQITEKPVTSLLIQTDYANDPRNVGFKILRFGTFDAAPARNPETGGTDGLTLASDNQGYYYRPLTEQEKDFALQRDWVLSCVCSLRSGGAFTEIDFGRAPEVPRFDIVLLQEGGHYFVGLPRKVSPMVVWAAKVEFPGVRDRTHPHIYELRYNHLKRTADLWIDGQLRESGYDGEQQYVDNHGVVFGVYDPHGEQAGEGVFQKVRFEAH